MLWPIVVVYCRSYKLEQVDPLSIPVSTRILVLPDSSCVLVCVVGVDLVCIPWPNCFTHWWEPLSFYSWSSSAWFFSKLAISLVRAVFILWSTIAFPFAPWVVVDCLIFFHIPRLALALTHVEIVCLRCHLGLYYGKASVHLECLALLLETLAQECTLASVQWVLD